MGTLALKARSIAYFTSRAATARSTGGAYRMPALSRTVTVFWSAEIWGSPSARSGRGRPPSSGLKEYRGRLTAYCTR